MRPARRAALVAASVAVALGVGACDALPGHSSSPTTSDIVVQPPPTGATDLTRFYEQKLLWRACGANECTRLTVPVDYDHPDGATIRLAVLKVPATKQSGKLGAIVVNPGGPGASGVTYAQAADFIVGKDVRRRYDIVGFDPRGVGQSSPIVCLGDQALDDFLSFDPVPQTTVQITAFAANARTLPDACRAKDDPLLAHVSTKDSARDMDILRAALGEKQLNYLGKSYGTFLGATYAGLFPREVGRFVLDGVLPPDLTSEEVNLGQAEGFERATRAWAADCAQRTDCPLGRTTDAVVQGLRDFFDALRTDPLTKTGDASVPELNLGWATLGVGYGLYEQSLWPTLDEALRQAVDERNGTGLMEMADRYADREKGGGYSSNLMQALYAVNCLDRPESHSLAAHQAAAARAEKVAPTWGAFIMWSSLACASWPDQPTKPPGPITAAGSNLIVVVGTTRDPATPYEWSVRLNNELAHSTLITYDGDGHTAYMRSNACVDDAIDAYYVSGTAPPANLRC